MKKQKNIFVAGATGVIGMRLCRMLVEDNWVVFGSTRDESKSKMLREIGVEPVVVDVYDEKNLEEILVRIQPQVVMHQLTDLPAGLNPQMMQAALVSNARLREIGTRNLIKSASKAGVQKMIAQSIAFVYEPDVEPYTEESALLNFDDLVYGATSRAVASLEEQVLSAPFVGIVLRNGLLYGAGTGFDAPVDFVTPLHVDACAYAAFLALACEKNALYNVTDDDKRVSTAKIKSELKWNPNYRM